MDEVIIPSFPSCDPNSDDKYLAGVPPQAHATATSSCTALLRINILLTPCLIFFLIGEIDYCSNKCAVPLTISLNWMSHPDCFVEEFVFFLCGKPEYLFCSALMSCFFRQDFKFNRLERTVFPSCGGLSIGMTIITSSPDDNSMISSGNRQRLPRSKHDGNWIRLPSSFLVVLTVIMMVWWQMELWRTRAAQFLLWTLAVVISSHDPSLHLG